MSQSTTFNMNRNSNSNNNNNRDGRITRADGSEDRSNTNTNTNPYQRNNRYGPQTGENTTPYQRNNRSNGPNGPQTGENPVPFQRNNRSNGPNGSRDNRNPFHRNNRDSRENRGNNGGGYKDWRNRGSGPYNPNPYAPVAPPPPKVLTADDFPALPTSFPSAKRVPDTNSWMKPEVTATWASGAASDDTGRAVTVAERVKEKLEEDAERAASGRLVEPEDEEKFDILPLSSWMRSKHLAKKNEEIMKQREADEYEANYRWQISRAMIPPRVEREMPAYEPGMEDEFEDATDERHNYEVEHDPGYEDRR